MPRLSSIPAAARFNLLPVRVASETDGALSIAGRSVRELAAAYGTSLYIFDQDTIVQSCQEYQRAFREQYHASKVHVLYAEQGLGLDIVSGGELLVAAQALFPLSPYG